MKKVVLILVVTVMCIFTIAQTPESFNYQVGVRDGGTNNPLVNQDVSFKMSILKGSSSGETQYSELHSANTGALGIVNLVIGNGTGKAGTISSIDWGADTYYLKVEIDKTGGSSYVEMGTTQLLSVPYALHAKTIASYTETDPVFIAHVANGITGTNITNWNSAYGWGNHSGLYRLIGYVPSWSEITSNPFSFVSLENNQLLKYNTTSSRFENWTPDFLTTEVDGSITNEIQTLSLSTNQLSISGTGGNTVTFTNWDTDNTNDVTTSGDQTIGGNKTFNGTTTVPTPVNATDAATKAYVDALLQTINQLESQPGIVKDVDGNLYTTIKIGTQVWMSENLKTTRYKDGTSIPLVTDNTDWSNLTTPGYCWYNNDAATYKATYGALYNWYTVNTGNLCPAGWHAPTDAEWTTLDNYLIANGYNYDGTTSGNKYAKALASTTLWTSSATVGAVGNTDYPDKRNATGFTALPGGYRYSNGTFDDVGNYGYWWSATEFDATDAWYRYMGFGISNVIRYFSSKKNGFSVRCLRD